MNILRLRILRDRGILIAVLLLIFSFTSGQGANGKEQMAKGQEPMGTLVITFTDIRSEVGNIVMGLYESEDQWTDNPSYSFSWDKKNLKNGVLMVEIDSLPIKHYACAVLDDEDESVSMNFIMGLPKEGWGMSTNPSFFKLKKPDFEDVAFCLDCPVLRVDIRMNYLNRNKTVK
jgi:uncharacterized protein (DUF2141 family)